MMQALQALPGTSCRASWDSSGVFCHGEGSSLLGRCRSNGSASTSRRLLETGGIAAGQKSGISGAYRSSAELGPANFALTEQVLRLWTAQANRKANKTPLWVSDVATSPAALTFPGEDSQSGEAWSFDWKTNWYPVSAEIDMDRSVPYPFYILGRKVVFWYDDEVGKKWNCVSDVCPHRLAPLSEGRVDERGCIQCSYHGWSFRGDGTCANIPQARKEGPEAKACDLSKSRVVAFPVVVKQGTLFVWPDEKSPELASKTEPPITPGIDGDGWHAVETFRDFAYSYDSGMENLVDPSHVPVAHHNVNGGVVGNRSQAAPLDLELPKVAVTGFKAELKKPIGPPSVHTFQPPARFTYEFGFRGIQAATTTYCVPTAPGKCRINVVNASNMTKGRWRGPEWVQRFSRSLEHQKMLNLLDGDVSLLHEQDRYLQERTHGDPRKWSKAYFMPTTADRYVGAFRQWLTRVNGGKGVEWAEGVDASLPPLITEREVLLDRYGSHTKQCRICSEALRKFELARKVFFTLAAVSLGVGAALANPVQRIQSVVFAALSGLLGWWLGGWIQMYYYKGYDHARIP